jgi:hypothetical protein
MYKPEEAASLGAATARTRPPAAAPGGGVRAREGPDVGRAETPSTPRPRSSPRDRARRAARTRSAGSFPRSSGRSRTRASASEHREVPFAYTPTQARAEALRCLSCKNEPCVSGCPVGVDVPRFLRLVATATSAARSAHQGDEPAAGDLRPRLPAGEPVPGELHGREGPQGPRFRVSGRQDRGVPRRTGSARKGGVELRRSGARAGSGWRSSARVRRAWPAPGDLRPLRPRGRGLEAFHKAGGVLVYGIPEFRLPKVDRAGRGRTTCRGWACSSSSTPSRGQTLSVDDLFDDGLRRGVRRDRARASRTS